MTDRSRPRAATPKTPSPDSFPSRLYAVPGFLADMTDWACRSVPSAHRAFAFGSALLTLSALTAGRLRLAGTSIAPNIGVLAVGPVASGTAASLAPAKDAAEKAGQMNRVGTDFASFEGFANWLRREPAPVWFMGCLDDFPFAHVYARQMLDHAADALAASRLCLSAHGTPERFADALRAHPVVRRIVEHAVVVEADPATAKPDNDGPAAWPAALDAAVRHWTKPAAESPVDVPFTRGVAAPADADPLVLKLATLHAASAAPEAPAIDRAALDWATAFVRHQRERIAAFLTPTPAE